MNDPELIGGLPRPWLKSHERESHRDIISRFALAIFVELRTKHPGIFLPEDILTVGDNWAHLLETRKPRNEAEIRMLEIMKDSLGELGGGEPFFTDNWPVYESRDPLRVLLGQLMLGVAHGSLPDRIREHIAVLDRTTPGVMHLFEPGEPTEQISAPWGQILTLPGYSTRIYLITDYGRKIHTPLSNSGDLSAGIMFNE